MELNLSKRPTNKPIIILSGASGFIGRHVVDFFKEDFYIYALARRTQKMVNINFHPNINWIRVDIGEKEMVEQVMEQISAAGGADYFIHLAGYYDFGNEPNPEYDRTNVNGTKNILDNIYKLEIKRFIFSSSLTVTEFNRPGLIINENSPANATFPYAISKRKAEEMLYTFSGQFPVTIIRLAAIFSDWCEYGPLYIFLSKWLSNKWDARILAGKGNSAVPYLHVRNLVQFFKTIIIKSENLPRYQIAIASPNGDTSHKELFEISRRYFFGQSVSAFYIPKWFAYWGVFMKDQLGKIIKRRPFERPWMIKYIDLRMNIDSSETQKLLNWKPIKRLHIKRRLLFLIEKMKSNPFIWNHKNEEALHKDLPAKCNLIICETMFKIENSVVKMTLNQLTSPLNHDIYPSYQKMDIETLTQRLEYIFRMIKTAIRTGDRMHILSYAHNLAKERVKENYNAQEVINANRLIADNIVSFLSAQPSLKNKSQWIYDEVMMTIQLIEDEIEETFEEEKK